MALGGISGNDLKQMTESSEQNCVKKKHGSMAFNEEYSPCIASTNLSSLAVFIRKWSDLRGEAKNAFDQQDWVAIFDDKEGRFSNLYFHDAVPEELRWAPSHVRTCYF